MLTNFCRTPGEIPAVRGSYVLWIDLPEPFALTLPGKPATRLHAGQLSVVSGLSRKLMELSDARARMLLLCRTLVESNMHADSCAVIGVNLALAPGLKPNQIITWHLNGKQLTDQPPDATSFVLGRLDRGAYAIAATVTDQATGESLSTGSVSFYVRQPSELSPQHK